MVNHAMNNGQKHLPDIPVPRLTPLAAACVALVIALIGGAVLALLT
jgi:hypothetical protein